MPILLLHFLNHPLLAFNTSAVVLVVGFFLINSSCNYLCPFTKPANCFTLIQISNNFSTLSRIYQFCSVKTFTPFAMSAALITSLFFSIMYMVDFSIEKFATRSKTCSTFMFQYYLLFHFNCGSHNFLFRFAIIIKFLWRH